MSRQCWVFMHIWLVCGAVGWENLSWTKVTNFRLSRKWFPPNYCHCRKPDEIFFVELNKCDVALCRRPEEKWFAINLKITLEKMYKAYTSGSKSIRVSSLSPWLGRGQHFHENCLLVLSDHQHHHRRCCVNAFYIFPLSLPNRQIEWEEYKWFNLRLWKHHRKR